MKTRSITLYVNDEKHTLDVPVNRTLLQVLRENLQMPETKYGCGLGEMRCLYRAVRWGKDYPRLSCFGCHDGWKTYHHGCRFRERWETPPGPAGVYRCGRDSVRLLHAGHGNENSKSFIA